MTVLAWFLAVQVVLQWVAIGLLVFRLVTGRWPRRAVTPEPVVPVPPITESVDKVLERLEAKPPVPWWGQMNREQKSAMAKELAEKARQLLPRL